MFGTMSESTGAAHHLDPRWIAYSAVRSLRALIVPIVIVLVSRGGSEREWGEIAIVSAIALFIILTRTVAWRRITYEIDERGIRLRTGVISRNERFLPADRIQAIDFQEDVIHRLLGVVEVKIESAAGAGEGADIRLEAVSRASAEQLRTALLQRRPEQEERQIGGAHQSAAAPDEALIARVPHSRLLLAGATSGRVGPALGLVFAAIQFGDDILPGDLEQWMFDSVPAPTAPVVAGAVLVGALLAWTLAIVSTLLTFGNFELRRVGNRLQATYGLLERRRVSIPLNRIQAITISVGLLRQPFGLAAIRAESAGYGKDTAESGVLMPLLTRQEIFPFLERACPAYAVDLDGVRFGRPPRRAMRRYLMAPVWAVLLVTVVTLLVALIIDARSDRLAWYSGLLPLIAAVPAALLGWLRYRDDGWWIGPAGTVVIRGRPLDRVTVITTARRIQHRTLASNPLQRRAGLVSFSAAVASGGSGGTMGIAHLDWDDGLTLFRCLGGVAESAPDWSA